MNEINPSLEALRKAQDEESLGDYEGMKGEVAEKLLQERQKLISRLEALDTEVEKRGHDIYAIGVDEFEKRGKEVEAINERLRDIERGLERIEGKEN